MAGWVFESELTTDGRALPPVDEVHREVLRAISADRYVELLKRDATGLRSETLRAIGVPHQRKPGLTACRQIISKLSGLDAHLVRQLLVCVASGLEMSAEDLANPDANEFESLLQTNDDEAVRVCSLLALDAEVSPSPESASLAVQIFTKLVSSDETCPETLREFAEFAAVPAEGDAFDLPSLRDALEQYFVRVLGELESGTFPDPAEMRERLADVEQVSALADTLGVRSRLSELEAARAAVRRDDDLEAALETLRSLRASETRSEKILARLLDALEEPESFSDALVALARLVTAQFGSADQSELRQLHEDWLATDSCPLGHDREFFVELTLGGFTLPDPEPKSTPSEASEKKPAATADDDTEPEADEADGAVILEPPDPSHIPAPVITNPNPPVIPPPVIEPVEETHTNLADDDPEPKSTPSEASENKPAEPGTSTALVASAIRARRLGVARQIFEEEDDLPSRAALDLFLHGEGFRTPTPRSDSITSLPEIRELLDLGAHDELRKISPVAAVAVATRLVLLGGYASGAVPWAESLSTAIEDQDAGLASVLKAAVGAAQVLLQVPEGGVGDSAYEAAVMMLSEQRDEAQQLIKDAPNRRFIYSAASMLYQRWCQPDGRLGAPLTAFIADEVGWVDRAKAVIDELATRGDIIDHVNRDHREWAPSQRKKGKAAMITARALEQLIENVSDARDLLAKAIDADAGRASAGTGRGGVREERMHELSSALGKLDLGLDRDPKPGLGGAFDWLGRESLGLTQGWIVDGSPLSLHQPLAVPARLALDLAFDATIRLEESEGRWRVGHGTLDRSLAASWLSERNGEQWIEASIRTRIESGDAATVAALMTSSLLADNVRAELDELSRKKFQEIRTRLERAVNDGETRLNSNRSLGRITEEDWPELSGLLEEAKEDLARDELARCDAGVERLTERLSEAQASAHTQLEERFKGLLAEHNISEADQVRVQQCLSEARLATAEEYLATLRSGSALPVITSGGEGLGVFFPAMNDKIAEQGRIDARASRQAERGGKWGPLHFDSLSKAERDDASKGLSAWSSLRGSFDAEDLRSILVTLGIEGVVETRRGGGKDRQAFEITKFRRNGKAMVPEFGSRSGGHDQASLLNLLVVTAEVGVDLLAQWAKDDERGTPLLVLYSGVLGSHDRRRLLSLMPKGRHAAVVDDSLFAYLTSASGRSYERTMRLTLPFTKVNPYRPGVAGQVSEEMFYGRLEELNELMELEGSSFVFGGRQLGKSALLVEARRRFRRRPACESVYLDLRGLNIGTVGGSPPSKVWDVLWNALSEAGVVPKPGKRPQLEDLHGGLTSWLEQNSSRRLLVLLDECDAFLETDAEQGFSVVAALKDLMDTTSRRVKIVFAGLHRVHRYDRVENHPLEHLGRPIAVGPLLPQAANDLISQPTAALGFEFESEELVARIQAIANNQPKQIVQFMRDLLESVQRRNIGSDEPPRLIRSTDVNRTAEKPELIEELSRTFDLTIRMDNAYRVIAYVMALRARRDGAYVVVPEPDLRKDATDWWPQGFEALGRDAFRSLCVELTVLGVLSAAPDQAGYRLRTPNLLRLLGTDEQIYERLSEATESEVEERYDPRQHRRIWDTGRLSPLAQDQIADLTDLRQSHVHLVVGTRSTGAHAVADALEREADLRLSGKLHVHTVDATSNQVTRRLKPGGRGENTLVVINTGDADNGRINYLIEKAVDAVREKREDAIGVVFVADERHERLWRQAFAQELPSEVRLVELRPVSDEVLRHSATVEDLPIADQESRQRVLESTDGMWISVDRIVESLKSGESLAAAIERSVQRMTDDFAPCLEMLEASVELRKSFEEFRSLLSEPNERLPRSDVDDLISSTDIDVLVTAGVLSVSSEGVGLAPFTKTWTVPET